MKIKAGIIGATGYAGAELVRLLTTHPNVEISAISSVSFEERSFLRFIRHTGAYAIWNAKMQMRL